MSFVIQPLQDGAQLADLHHQAFDPAIDPAIDPTIGQAWDAPAFERLLQQKSVQAFGTSHGFILLQTVAEEAEILTLAVHPDARRAGLARALIGEAQKTLRAARIFLEVAQDNRPARALYAGMGFVECGRRAAYYKRPDGARVDALILQLETPQ